MAKRFGAIFSRLASERPTHPGELSLSDGRLVDVDDALAGHQLVQKEKCKLLPLDQGTIAVRPRVDSLDSLEPELKLVGQTAAHKLFRDLADAILAECLKYLSNTLDVAALAQDRVDSLADCGNLLLFDTLFLLPFYEKIQPYLALASKAADEADGDVELLGDVSAPTFFDQPCVHDAN